VVPYLGRSNQSALAFDVHRRFPGRVAELVWLGIERPSVGSPIGTAAGPYGQGTRRSFVLHIADELIHHRVLRLVVVHDDVGQVGRADRTELTLMGGRAASS
jgi:hypothetical protein